MAQVKPESINSLGDKLDDFAKSLSAQERAVLGYVLTRAEAAESDAEVEGYALPAANLNLGRQLPSTSLKSGLSSQLGRSVGIPGGSNPVALTISWGW